MTLDYLLHDDSTNLNAVWVKDSETSREYLVDLKTGETLLEKKDGKIINPEEK